MGGRYDIMQRVKEMLEASDPLKYGNAEQARSIEVGPAPQITTDPRLEELLRSPGSPEVAASPPPAPLVPPPPQQQVPPPTAANLARGQEELVELLRDGRKIMAVKRYRELTGAGLAEAKAAIDELEQRIEAGEDAFAPEDFARPADSPDMDALAAQVVALVRGGNKIEAIRVYREAMQVDLREAKEAVEQLEARLRQERSAPPPAQRAGRPVPAWMSPVVDQLQRGNKIGAIKAYRDATGVGLAEAKATVEALERQLAGRG
jgi:ribosomal protein L7/L12